MSLLAWNGPRTPRLHIVELRRGGKKTSDLLSAQLLLPVYTRNLLLQVDIVGDMPEHFQRMAKRILDALHSDRHV